MVSLQPRLLLTRSSSAVYIVLGSMDPPLPPHPTTSYFMVLPGGPPGGPPGPGWSRLGLQMQFIAPSDLMPFLQRLLAVHPGLEFLKVCHTAARFTPTVPPMALLSFVCLF